MVRFSWTDSEGPEDFDWSKEQFDIFKDATGYDPTVDYSESDEPFMDADFAQAAALFDQGFVHMEGHDSIMFTRDWFFDWMDDHGWDISDFDWDSWRDQYETTAG